MNNVEIFVKTTNQSRTTKMGISHSIFTASEKPHEISKETEVQQKALYKNTASAMELKNSDNIPQVAMTKAVQAMATSRLETIGQTQAYGNSFGLFYFFKLQLPPWLLYSYKDEEGHLL